MVVSVGKGQVHEGIIHNSDKGSVITWDFDVMRHDVVFTVYRLRIPLPIKSPQVSPTPTSVQTKTFTFPSAKDAAPGTSAPAPGGSTTATAASSAHPAASDSDQNKASSRNHMPLGYAETVSDHKSVLEKQGGEFFLSIRCNFPKFFNATFSPFFFFEFFIHFLLMFNFSGREGHDYYKVEASIVCHDGESIQGSHVTSHVGTYVLQWRFFDKHASSHHSHNPLDVIDSLTTVQHKAKIMYYYETLSSVDYRGSMTSLQSCQSAFSNVSKVSKHSTSGVSSGVSSNHSEQRLIPTVTVMPPPSAPAKTASQPSSCSTSKHPSSSVISECGTVTSERKSS